MTDRVWIFLIVATAVVLVVFLLRKQLRRLFIKGGGIEAEVDAYKQPEAPPGRPGSVNITGNKLIGKRQGIEVERDDVNVSDNKLKGEDQEILVKPDSPPSQ